MRRSHIFTPGLEFRRDVARKGYGVAEVKRRVVDVLDKIFVMSTNPSIEIGTIGIGRTYPYIIDIAQGQLLLLVVVRNRMAGSIDSIRMGIHRITECHVVARLPVFDIGILVRRGMGQCEVHFKITKVICRLQAVYIQIPAKFVARQRIRNCRRLKLKVIRKTCKIA